MLRDNFDLFSTQQWILAFMHACSGLPLTEQLDSRQHTVIVVAMKGVNSSPLAFIHAIGE